MRVSLHTGAQIVPGRWDLAGLCGTGSFDWALSDVFLPDLRTMPRRHPSRGPMGAPARRQLCIAGAMLGGPSHSAVITGIARARRWI